MRIDAHQHYWSIARGDYGWLTPTLAPIYRDFGPADLAPLLARHGLSQTILVQAAPTDAETAYMLAIADEVATVAGVVGWTDFEAGTAAERVVALAANPKLVGLRPMIHDIIDDRWMLKREIEPAIEAMMSTKLVFDALVRPRHLQALDIFVRRHASLQVVIDHAAKPEIAKRRLDPWRADMDRLARCANVSVKLSGLATEASPDWTAEDLAPYFDHLVETFGAHRILWGSDWPVLNLAGDYDRWWHASRSLMARLPAGDVEAILGDNATRLYLAARKGSGC